MIFIPFEIKLQNYCTVKKVNMKKEYEGCIHQVDEKKCKAIRHTPVDKGITYTGNISGYSSKKIRFIISYSLLYLKITNELYLQSERKNKQRYGHEKPKRY